MGKNAASVFPPAVGAEMITSWSPARTGSTASAWAGRKLVQPLPWIQRRTPRCSRSAASEAEVVELVVLVGCTLTTHGVVQGGVDVLLDHDAAQQVPPVGAGVLLEDG